MNERKMPVDYPSKKGFANVIGMAWVDPLGSYTGRPADEDEEPIQDADDL